MFCKIDIIVCVLAKGFCSRNELYNYEYREMKQFLYLDYDIVNSIIAQSEKGLIEKITTESGKESQKRRKRKLTLGADGGASNSFLKLAKAEASLSIGGDFETEKNLQENTKQIIAKTLHDASYDIAYGLIRPSVVEFGKDSASPGEYIELKRVFDFVDFDYLERVFSERSVAELIKKREVKKVKDEADNFIQKNLNREQKRSGTKVVGQIIAEQENKIEMQYNDITETIKLVETIIPYKRLLLSNDGYLIPVEDKYFRVNPKGLGFVYGGEITVVGMISNSIGKANHPSNSDNLFYNLQYNVNEVLRIILQVNKPDLYVLSPIAIYYE